MKRALKRWSLLILSVFLFLFIFLHTKPTYSYFTDFTESKPINIKLVKELEEVFLSSLSVKDNLLVGDFKKDLLNYNLSNKIFYRDSIEITATSRWNVSVHINETKCKKIGTDKYDVPLEYGENKVLIKVYNGYDEKIYTINAIREDSITLTIENIGDEFNYVDGMVFDGVTELEFLAKFQLNNYDLVSQKPNYLNLRCYKLGDDGNYKMIRKEDIEIQYKTDIEKEYQPFTGGSEQVLYVNIKVNVSNKGYDVSPFVKETYYKIKILQPGNYYIDVFCGTAATNTTPVSNHIKIYIQNN